jgi:hypothetical protein
MIRYRIMEHPEGRFKVEESSDGGLTWDRVGYDCGFYEIGERVAGFLSVKRAKKLIECLKERERAYAVKRVIYEE